MKKILLFFAVSLISIASLSQLNVGLQGTGSLADAQIKTVSDLNYKKKMKAMPGAGIVVQYGLTKHFAIRTGANYIQHGIEISTVTTDGSDMRVKLESRLHYVQIPLNFLYTVPLSRIQFYAGGGGYINYGFNGNMTATATYTMPNGHETTQVEKSDAFKKEEDGGYGFKKTDFGIGALAGVRFGRIFANAGYQLSLSNLNTGDGGGEYRNRSLQFTIGYFLR